MHIQHSDPEFNRIKLGFLLLLALIAVCILSGCTPNLQKALDKVTETEQNAEIGLYTIHNKYKPLTAAWSATVYQISESTDTETTVEPGNVQEFKDKASKAEAKADSLLEALNSLPVKPECKDEASDRDKVIYSLQSQLKGLHTQAKELRADKEKVVTKVVQESTAKVDDMQHKLTQLKAELLAEKQAHLQTLEEKTLLRTERNRAYIALAVIGVLFILAILRKFSII